MDLEGKNSGLIIIDINVQTKYRLINIYRAFNPTNGMTQKEQFLYQIGLIKQALNSSQDFKPLIMGDFDLNEQMKYISEYSHRA